MRRLNAVGSTA